MLLASAFALGLSTTTAEAYTICANKCKTYGTYSTGGGYTDGCPGNFSIYMHPSGYNSSVTTISNDRVLNWTYVYIDIEVSALSSHSSFRLTRYGSTYTSRSLSGTSNMTLFAGSLPDGDYELTYVATHKPHWYSGTTTYTYKYRFVIDKTPPTYSLKAGASTIYNGAYTNQQITYSAKDSYRDWCIYYQRPGYSSYNITYSTIYTVPTSATNGWYYFYAEDYYYNTTTPVCVYLDTVKPVGTVTSNAGYTVSNGGYTNRPIKYTASDTGGVATYQMKGPYDTSWTSYSSGTYVSNAYGWYTFRSIDRAGNISDEYRVFYDAAAPVGTLYGGTVTKPSGAYTNASYVKYTASDSNSGLAGCYVKMPNSTYYTAYASGTQLSMDGTYYFYSVDRSGNQSSTLTITLDKTAPTGTLYAGNTAIPSGGHTNASYIRYVPYDAICIANNYVLKPGSSSYVSYTSGTQFTAEGIYRFYSVDRAGNMSQYYTVTLSRKVPKAQLYVDEQPFDNYGYTNGQYVKFESEADSCYVKLPNSDKYIMYVSGTEFYKPGKYIFYGVDVAGNVTGNYNIVIDRTSKPAEFLNVTDGVTDGDVVIDWLDGDADLYAPIVDVKINGKTYAKDSVIHTIDTGRYTVQTTDAAGNVWQSEFTSTKNNIETKTFQKKYYEAYDNDGVSYTFSSYESALSFGAQEERKFVWTGEWTNEIWDIGMPMDAKDSVNAANGTYYVYKRSGFPDEEIAYFTDERLSEVIREYAAVRITDYFYWEKEYAPIANGENMFSYSDDRTILADEIVLGEYIGCEIDGEEFVGDVVTLEGKHTLTVLDAWGNSCDYQIFVVRSASDIRYAIGEGTSILATFDRIYYFKDAATVMIADEIDEFAMFQVYDEDGISLGRFSLGETYTITESGTYTVQAINHFGLSDVFTLIISRDAPKVSMIPDALAKRLDVSIMKSIDKENHIRTLEIYKTVDDGETWNLLAKDDYGTPISLDSLEYEFRTTGRYKVVISDEFRTGIDAVVMELDYVQPKPYAELSGVEDGGYTNGEVSFQWTDEANVMIERNGAVLMTRSGGGHFTEDGSYEIRFSNFDGYEKIYTFTIDTIKPDVEIDGAQDKACVKTDVAVTWEEEDLIAKLYKNGELVGDYTSGTVIKEDGSYKVIVSDLAENTKTVEFVIDKTVDYSINVNEKGLANAVEIITNEKLDVTLTKNGNVIEYDFANPIMEPGKYVLTLTDALGNSVTNEFEIIQPIVQSFEYNFDETPGFEMALVDGEFKRLNYGTLELKKEGRYEVGVVINGKTYTFFVTVDQSAPTVSLTGVSNGGKTTGGVTISNPSELNASIEVYKNGEKIEYELGQEITEHGAYKVVLKDEAGNVGEYSFTIQKKMSGGLIALFVILGIAAVGGGVFAFLFIRKRKKSQQ